METANKEFWSKVSSIGEVTPVDPEATTPYATVLRFAKEARNEPFYRKLYQLELAMSGDRSTLEDLAKGGWSGFDGAGSADLPFFPDIDPDLGPEGVQNHQLVGSRINIQAITLADPGFVVPSSNPMVRTVVQSWLKDVWEDNDLSGKAYEVGLDVEAMGMGFMEWGCSDGTVTGEVISPLNVLWDQRKRNPADWRYFFIRRFLDVDEAHEKYGHVLPREFIEGLAQQISFFPVEHGKGEGLSKAVIEWNYWDKTSHCVFLGGISGDNNVVMVINEETMMYEPMGMEDTAIGRNPFGIVPVAIWFDSMSPGVRRPVGKTETVLRSSSMVAKIEKAMSDTVNKGAPIDMLNVDALAPDQIVENLEKRSQLDKIGSPILIQDSEIEKAWARVPAADIPMSHFQARELYLNELKGAQGVTDSMRGQYSSNDRTTAQEVRAVESNGGIQSRHTRRQYRKFLGMCLRIMLAIGSRYESKPRMLSINDVLVDTTMFPVRPFLSIRIPLSVQESSLATMSEEERKQARMLEFQTLDIPLVELGVGNPMKIAQDVLRDTGEADPNTRLYTEEEYAQQQLMRQLSEQANAGRDQSGSGSGGPSNGGSGGAGSSTK